MPITLAKLVAGAVAALALLPAAAQADVAPFGHACTLENGARFCPTPDLASRPRSFDGTPIDVDVTLPPTGDGPFPTILLLHGLGGDKTTFESKDSKQRYTSWFFAQHGYAVVTPTARGFAGSCGRPSADSPGCEQGWTRLGDMRYEVRDVQTLVGLLVDEGIVKPDAIGSTGISYGGGFSTMLAFLKNRVRLPDGSYAPWTSPAGVPISLTAAWPRWLWSNGESIFTRNGRGPWSRQPTGVTAQSYAAVIFAVAFSANVAPAGGDLSTDISLWKQQLDSGLFDASTQKTLDNAFNFHGVAGVTRASGGPSPLLLQSGWTDALFPVGQALGAYNAVRAADPAAPVALQVSDSGHNPGVNHPVDVAAFEDQGIGFFDAWLKGPGNGAKPAPGSVTAYTMVCPASRPAGGGPFTAKSFKALARGARRFAYAGKLKITSAGASAELASKVSGVGPTGALCTPQKKDRSSKATFGTFSSGFTLIGQPVISGKALVSGRYGQMAARVWDFDPRTRTQRLITRGVYRFKDNEKGSFKFTLDGNGWKFAPDHLVEIELLGRDAPTYGPSPATFKATLSEVKVKLPVREKPNRKKRITKP
jgi:fermentation-respiration switch protein FrsA (DUF1100 family)